jgi:hypothetical protein
MNHLLNLFSGKDNQTLDLGRVLWALISAVFLLGCLVFLALAVLAVQRGQAWDAGAYGSGFLALLTGGTALLLGGAGSLAVKAKTEPEAKPAPPPEGAQ